MYLHSILQRKQNKGLKEKDCLPFQQMYEKMLHFFLSGQESISILYLEAK